MQRVFTVFMPVPVYHGYTMVNGYLFCRAYLRKSRNMRENLNTRSLWACNITNNIWLCRIPFILAQKKGHML